MTKELSIIPDSKELVRQSTDIASLCREIVIASSVVIDKRKYVRVEGWQAIATAHGCVASARDVARVEGGMIAVGEIRRMQDGQLIATAEGFVGEDEPTWYGGEIEKNEWKNGQKTGKRIKTVMPKRAEYAIRAMAQTRAISRACRGCFAHVVVLMNAGLSTTPAEEVPEGGFNDDVIVDTVGNSEDAGGATPKKPSLETEAEMVAWYRENVVAKNTPDGFDQSDFEGAMCKVLSTKCEDTKERTSLDQFTLAELKGPVKKHYAFAVSEVHRMAKEGDEVKLTTERLILNAYAMLAHANGKLVQVRSDGEPNWTTLENCKPSWQFEHSEYRPKPEPVYRPWNRDTIPSIPFGVISKASGNKLAIVCANNNETWLGGCDQPLSYEKLLSDYTLNDGSICGRES